MELFFFLSTRGRNSGIWRPLEVWFVELSGTFYLLAEAQEQPDWVKNIEANPEVRFSVGTRRKETSERPHTQGRARVLSDASDGELCASVRASMYGKYRWSSGTLVEIT